MYEFHEVFLNCGQKFIYRQIFLLLIQVWTQKLKAKGIRKSQTTLWTFKRSFMHWNLIEIAPSPPSQEPKIQMEEFLSIKHSKIHFTQPYLSYQKTRKLNIVSLFHFLISFLILFLHFWLITFNTQKTETFSTTKVFYQQKKERKKVFPSISSIIFIIKKNSLEKIYIWPHPELKVEC